MQFRIERKLDYYKQDKLIIQAKRWCKWRDLWLLNDLEPDGWEFYQVEFNIDKFLEAKKFKEILETNKDKRKKYFTSILGFMFKLKR